MARTKQTARKAAEAARNGQRAAKVPRATVAAAGAKKGRNLATARGAKEKKPHRFRPGTVALREIRKMQMSTDLKIPRAPFLRLLRETMQGFHADLRLQTEAVEALREAAEAFLIHHFEMTQAAAVHAQRVTIMPRDSQLVCNTAKALNISTYQDTRYDNGCVNFARTPSSGTAPRAERPARPVAAPTTTTEEEEEQEEEEEEHEEEEQEEEHEEGEAEKTKDTPAAGSKSDYAGDN